MANNKRSTKFYRRNEEEVMKKLGLKPTANSGAGWKEKEDGQNDYIICQLKSTDKKSISVKLEDIHTLEYNAIVAHKIPVFAIQFLQSDEIFIMVKPYDLPNISKYLECGSCDVAKTEVDISEEQTKKSPREIIESSIEDREAFWDEYKKEKGVKS